jgi:hypothetical protein
MNPIGQCAGGSTVPGSPRTGPRRYELNRELEFGRPAQLGATPFAEGPALALAEYWASRNMRQKQKTAVENLKIEPIDVNNSTARGGSV